MPHRWQALCKENNVPDESSVAALNNWTATFNALIGDLKTNLKKEIATWALSSAPARFEALQKKIETLETVNTNIAMHVTTLEDRAKMQKKAEMTLLRKATAERKRLLSNWRDASVHPEDRLPMSFLRYMLDNAMLIDGHGVGTEGTNVACYDANCGEFNESNPWLVLFNEDGPGKDLSLLRNAVGEKRIEDAIGKAESYLDKNTNEVTCDMRFQPLGGGQDHVEELAWVPRAWREKSYTPEALRSLSTPWLLTHHVAGTRQDPCHWPMPGFGHFLSVVRGDMLVCLIPAQAALERGATMSSCVSFLGQLPWKDFELFVNKHCEFAQLKPGRALWVPYGWRTILLSRSPMTHSHALYIPYVNTRMLMTCSLKDEVLGFAKCAMEDWAKHMKQDMCFALSKEALTWLDIVAALNEIPHNAMPVTPRALEDAYV